LAQKFFSPPKEERNGSVPKEKAGKRNAITKNNIKIKCINVGIRVRHGRILYGIL